MIFKDLFRSTKEKMNNSFYLDKWVSCLILYYKDEFQDINNLEMVHEDDQKFVKENFTNTIYHCYKIDINYLFLKSKEYEIKVKKTAIKEILPSSKFKWKDKVNIIGKPSVNAIIDDLFWHSKDEEYKYYLVIDGKRKSKYYTSKDFETLK